MKKILALTSVIVLASSASAFARSNLIIEGNFFQPAPAYVVAPPPPPVVYYGEPAPVYVERYPVYYPYYPRHHYYDWRYWRAHPNVRREHDGHGGRGHR